jgi:hypothetical protein
MLAENPEQLTEPLNIKISPSMKADILAYAQKHKVAQAVAVRHMITHFLSDDFRKTEVCCYHAEVEPTI